MSNVPAKSTFSRIERMIATTLTGLCLGLPLAYLASAIYADLDVQAVGRHQGIYVKHVDLRPVKIRNLKRPFKIKMAKKLKVDRVDTSKIVIDAYKKFNDANNDRIPTVRKQSSGLKPRDPFAEEILSKSERPEE